MSQSLNGTIPKSGVLWWLLQLSGVSGFNLSLATTYSRFLLVLQIWHLWEVVMEKTEEGIFFILMNLKIYKSEWNLLIFLATESLDDVE